MDKTVLVDKTKTTSSPALENKNDNFYHFYYENFDCCTTVLISTCFSLGFYVCIVNEYVITWILRQIFIFSNKVKLAVG